MPPLSRDRRVVVIGAGSSGLVSAIHLARAGLEVTGKTHDFDDIGTSGMRVLRRSCAACGSPMFTLPDATPTLLMVKVGGFHQTDWINPTAELFVIRRLRWVNPIPGATQYEGNPPA